MKLAEFPLMDPQVFTVSPQGSAAASQKWQANAEARLWSDASGMWLSQGSAPVEVSCDGGGLDLLLSRKELPWLLLRDKGAQLHLQCAQPADWLPLDEPLEIGVDEMLAQQMPKDLGLADVEGARAWCAEEFLIEGERPRLAAVRHRSAVAGDWQIVGRGWRADLQRDRDGRIVIKRITRANLSVDSWSLIEGDIRFVDASATAKMMSEGQQALLWQAIANNGDYVVLWRMYSEKEWQRSLRQAGQLGALAYSQCERARQEGGAWRFRVEPDALAQFRTAWQSLESDNALALEAGARCPDWQHEHYQDLTKADSGRRFRGRPSFERGAIVIESEQSSPPDDGYLYLSLAGDRTVQERRQKALLNINTAARSMKLRFILQGLAVPTPRLERHEALTANAKECFKHGDATDSQKDAIKMALETPDIALIIGPPGTGKTQVIAALSRRLSEIGGETGSQHQVLIASFQHDAVENALARTQVYDLPAVKVGQRRGAESLDPIKAWCESKYEALGPVLVAQEEKEGHVPLLRKLNQDLAMLRHSQLDDAERRTLLESADESLRALESRHRLRLPASLCDEWCDYLQRLPRAVKPERGRSRADVRARALRKLRGLRVTPVGFADDGPDRAGDARLALVALGCVVAPEDLQALAGLEERHALSDDDARATVALRDRLLDALLPDYRPPAVRLRLDATGLRLIGAVEDALADKIKGSRLGVSGVLARYRDTFVNHRSRTRDTVREYAMVVGATCQQAASKAMAGLKELSGIGDAGISFDTVIIDEAARANPLDLFIPLSMAGRRVILVGDHRQLPHLLEADVENELAETEGLTKDQRKSFEESLFERLWRQLKDRQAADGFSRVVMLDTQFRMHPVLGEFVSKEFYESVGLAPLKPGKPASAFMSSIPGYEGKVCGWLDVPMSHGSEDKRGNSRMRETEARCVAVELVRLLKTCDPKVTIGVITFYSAQRDVIFETLASEGIAERDAESESRAWRVAGKWKSTPDGSERLRIGTVDAFQGKEFDIVLLSVVRASDTRLPRGEPGSEAWEKAASRKFGHLRLSNRMNVAMSRQRSLLLVVGSRAMASGADATAAVPALAAYLKLCEGEHGIVR